MFNRYNNIWPISIALYQFPHLQKQETVSSRSRGSTEVGGEGEASGTGEGGTLRYLTCSTWRAARAPLRRRMPTGQRRGLVSSAMGAAGQRRGARASRRGNGARGCAPRATDGVAAAARAGAAAARWHHTRRTTAAPRAHLRPMRRQLYHATIQLRDIGTVFPFTLWQINIK